MPNGHHVSKHWPLKRKLAIRYHDTKCKYLSILSSKATWVWPPLPVLNIFFARALTERLRGEPIIVNTVNPGYCHSNLSRNMPSIVIMLDKLAKWIFARTTEQGSRSLVWAAIGGDEDRDKLRGAYVALCQVSEASDYVLSDGGKRAQDVLWVSAELFLQGLEHSDTDYRDARMTSSKNWLWLSLTSVRSFSTILRINTGRVLSDYSSRRLLPSTNGNTHGNYMHSKSVDLFHILGNILYSDNYSAEYSILLRNVTYIVCLNIATLLHSTTLHQIGGLRLDL